MTVHEIGTERGLDFIAMEYVEGRSLAQLIPAKGLPVQRALEYAIQIAEGWPRRTRRVSSTAT